MKPKVSIIIPAYNVENYIGEAIQSVLKQTYQDFELLVVNDGSTDRTLDVIDTYTDRRIRVINQVNSGVSVARNVGIDNATGEYIAFLDGDDRYEPTFLELMTLNISGDMIYCGYYKFDESGNLEHFAKEYVSGDILYENVAGITQVFVNATLIKRDALIQSKIRFIPGCVYGEDTDFQYRLLCMFETSYIAQELIGYRQSRKGSATSNKNSYKYKAAEMLAYKNSLDFIKQNYRGRNYTEVIAELNKKLDYVIYRTVLYAIREKKYVEANKLLNENNINKETRNFKQRIKWILINTRNRLIWEFL